MINKLKEGRRLQENKGGGTSPLGTYILNEWINFDVVSYEIEVVLIYNFCRSVPVFGDHQSISYFLGFRLLGLLKLLIW